MVDQTPYRARRVLARLYALDESGGTKIDLEFPSGIAFCLAQGWAVLEGEIYKITAAGRQARENFGDLISLDSNPVASLVYLPPGPYLIERTGEFVYIIDATGNKIANLLGPRRRKMALAKLICEAWVQHADSPKLETV